MACACLNRKSTSKTARSNAGFSPLSLRRKLSVKKPPISSSWEWASKSSRTSTNQSWFLTAHCRVARVCKTLSIWSGLQIVAAQRQGLELTANSDSLIFFPRSMIMETRTNQFGIKTSKLSQRKRHSSSCLIFSRAISRRKRPKPRLSSPAGRQGRASCKSSNRKPPPTIASPRCDCCRNQAAMTKT